MLLRSALSAYGSIGQSDRLCYICGPPKVRVWKVKYWW